ncbi:MAG: hypothetical protein RL189_1150 [Pseudomonadota bacterium]
MRACNTSSLVEVGETPEAAVVRDWSHRAEGSLAERGLVFNFSLLPVNDGLTDRLFEDFKPFIPALQDALRLREFPLNDSCGLTSKNLNRSAGSVPSLLGLQFYFLMCTLHSRECTSGCISDRPENVKVDTLILSAKQYSDTCKAKLIGRQSSRLAKVLIENNRAFW